MKLITSVLLPALFAAAAVANPMSCKRWDDKEWCCTEAQVNHIVELYHQHLTNPDRNDAADKVAPILIDDYMQFSESVNSLAGTPFESPIQSSKAQWLNEIRASGSPVGPVEDLLVVHDCKYIVWYWRMHGLGTNQYEVQGMHIFNTTNDCTQLFNTHFEFNSIAWSIDVK